MIGGSKADPGIEPRSRLRAGCVPQPVLQQRVRTLRRCQAGVWRWDTVGPRSYSGRSLTGSQVQYKPHARSGHYLNFFLFPFREKSLISLEGKSMTLHRGNTILLRSSQQLPCLCLEVARRPSRALNSPPALLPELQNYRETRTHRQNI